MHQPYYDTTDRDFWDRRKEQQSSAGRRPAGPTSCRPRVVQDAGRPAARRAVDESWSRSLMEPLDPLRPKDGLCGVAEQARTMRSPRIARDQSHPRPRPAAGLSADASTSPLIALIPGTRRHCQADRRAPRRNPPTPSAFQASPILFPRGQDLHMRVPFPALIEAGVEATISRTRCHRFRSLQGLPTPTCRRACLRPTPPSR